MPKRYDSYDRVAVVTGSDSGIGEAVAVALAKAGFGSPVLDTTYEQWREVLAAWACSPRSWRRSWRATASP
ncbi:MAG TPA: hypothetical protein VFB84_10320 [Micromonosporaceae bacterium]|nr:hypothetical protein [Micromonosporaceae bacterium]